MTEHTETPMLDFKPITVRDKDWVTKIVMAENSPSADYNFGNMYIWDKYYKQLLCPFEGRLLVKLCYEDKPIFVYPVGQGPVKPAIDVLREHAEQIGCPLVLEGVTEVHKEILEKEYPGKFIFEENEESADYIYLAQKLSSFSGKALHSKKNHCNRFEAEHEWEFVPITKENIPECHEMLISWINDNRERLDESISFELEAIEEAFAVYGQLDMEGGILKSEGKVMGFSLGEMSNSDCFNVHFEKADPSVNGAYPMVCRELCRMVMKNHPDLKYINREDDMGLPSLRRSKLSYKPEYILKKYSARWKDE